ncbi:MAG: site-specific DNA-methyltransferase [Candidatus Omnitrophica bacterium]|nr:site-specific DNA-methyltransferase [Candidatus Omnitrophota bacterium]
MIVNEIFKEDVNERFNKLIEVIKNNGFEYFQTNYGVFINADNKDVIKVLPKYLINVVITDPPYLLSSDNFTKKREDYGDESSIFMIEDGLYNLLPLNSWFIIYWSVKNLSTIFKLKKFKYKWMLIAIFTSSVSKSVIGDRRYFPIFCFTKGEPKVVFRRPDVVYTEELPFVQERIKKPDFKPTGINVRLLQMFVKKSDIVFDPFAGYGSLQVVAEIFKRYWIAVEKNKERYEAAKNLITNWLI